MMTVKDSWVDVNKTNKAFGLFINIKVGPCATSGFAAGGLIIYINAAR